MTILSLRGVISGVSALSVAVVAAVTLSITLTSSVSVLRSVGTGHALALLRAATLETQALFDLPQDACNTIQNITRTRDYAWPSDDAAVLTMYRNLHHALYVQPKFRLNTILTYFSDNTLMISSRLSEPDGTRLFPPNQFESTVYNVSSLTAAIESNTTQTINSVMTDVYNRGNYSIMDPSDPRVPMMVSYPNPQLFVNTSWWNSEIILAARGTRGLSVGVAASEYNGVVANYIPFVMALRRPSDDQSGPSKFFGVTSAVLGFAEINQFLAATRATPATEAYAYDLFGFLLGSSQPRPTEVIERVPPGTPNPLGCTSTDRTDPTQPNVFQVCRLRAQDYGSPALAALTSDRSLMFAESPVVEIMRAAGDVYYTASAPIAMRFSGIHVQLALFMPEADIIGDLVSSRNTAIAITCAVFVIAALVTFVLISMLLAPLTDVAEDMVRAANFEPQDDDAANGVTTESRVVKQSAMSEVADLQEAFDAMAIELNRIRSFVPQSVLARKANALASANGMDDDDGYDDGPLGALESTTTQDNTSTRSRRSFSSQRSRASTQRSKQSRLSAPEVIATTALDTMCALDVKPIAVLVANARGFTRTHQRGPDAVRAIAELSEHVVAAVVDARGVLSHFHGDHFVATFNAVVTCGGYAARACAAAKAITECCSQTATTGEAQGVATADRTSQPAPTPAIRLDVRCGVASGRCMVGNVGCGAAKTFSAIGPAYHQATVLERLAPRYGQECRVLATHRTCVDAATRYRARFVDIVPLPGKGPCVIGSLGDALAAHGGDGRAINNGTGGATGLGDQEWLYVVGDADNADPAAIQNEAFVAVHELNMGRLATLMDRMGHKPTTDPSGDPASRPVGDLPVPPVTPESAAPSPSSAAAVAVSSTPGSGPHATTLNTIAEGNLQRLAAVARENPGGEPPCTQLGIYFDTAYHVRRR